MESRGDLPYRRKSRRALRQGDSMVDGLREQRGFCPADAKLRQFDSRSVTTLGRHDLFAMIIWMLN